MKTRIALGISLTSAFLVAFLVSTSSVSVFATPNAAPVPSCFYFTLNGSPNSITWCTNTNSGPKAVNANDLAVVFKPGSNCNVAFGTLAQACPKGANNIEVFWGMTATGATVVTSCEWTHGKKVLTTPCTVTPNTTAFTVSGTLITKAWWTLNGKRVSPVFTASSGTNDIEWYLMGSTST